MGGVTKNHRGFALIELMVVIAILSWLASLAVPRFLKNRMLQRRAECHQSLQSLHDRQKQYFEQHQGYATRLEELGWIPPQGLFQYQIASPPPTGFLAECRGNIDRDSTLDRATIDETGTIQQLDDDLRQ